MSALFGIFLAAQLDSKYRNEGHITPKAQLDSKYRNGGHITLKSCTVEYKAFVMEQTQFEKPAYTFEFSERPSEISCWLY